MVIPITSGLCRKIREIYLLVSSFLGDISIFPNKSSVLLVNETKLSKEEMSFGYRTSRCHFEDLIVLQAEFELIQKTKEEVQTKIDDCLAFRKSHQPLLSMPNCGSIFKNPESDSAGRMIEAVGAKGLTFGGAKIWENHANFIVNYKSGNSLDVLELMNTMYTKVKERYNIELEPEIRFLGGNNKRENEICKTLYKK